MPKIELLRRVCRNLYTLIRSGRVGAEGSKAGLAQLVTRWATRAHIPYEELGARRTLAGSSSTSGRGNELDAVFGRSPEVVVVELKNWRHEVPPKEAMFLLQKTLDHWTNREPTSAPLYPVLAVTSHLKEEARRFCFIWGIVPIEPDLLPPTVILDLLERYETARRIVPEKDQQLAAELFEPFSRGVSGQLAWLTERRGRNLRTTLLNQLDFHESLSNDLKEWFESPEGALPSWISELEPKIRC